MREPITRYLQARTSQRLAEQEGARNTAVALGDSAKGILREAGLDPAVVDLLLAAVSPEARLPPSP